MFVFLDESGTDCRESLRKFGYSMSEKCTRSHKLLIGGKRVSVVVAMSTNGILDYRLVRGRFDAMEFKKFVEKCLLRRLMPFDGINLHSIVTMDNASIHHAGNSIKLIESMEALVLFVPYSPKLNAIEEEFSSIKAYIKANEEVLQQTDDIEKVLAEAIASILPENCQAWIKDSGYTY